MKSKLSLILSLAVAATLLWANSTTQAQTYVANLDGPSESPPNASPGTGFATITLNLALHTLQIDVTFSGLTGTTSAAHIHGPTAVPGTGTAGIATQSVLTGFPFGVTSGSYSHIFDTLDTATYSSGFLAANGGTAAGAEAGLASTLANGTAYFNIHSSTFPGGEIRGFLAVPEPATVSLIALGGVGLLFAARRAQRT
ncbi:MAG: CHRD domain-containing protein [Verrucomicrobiota bacterium]